PNLASILLSGGVPVLRGPATTPAIPDRSPATIVGITTTSAAGGGMVSLSADGLVATADITAAGTVLIAPSTPTRPIDLGGGPDIPKLVLSGATLNHINAPLLQIGYLTGFTGDITVSGGIDLTANFNPHLALVTGGSITENAGGGVAVGSLALWAGGNVSFP